MNYAPVLFEADTHTFRRQGSGDRVLSVTQILAGAGLCDFSCVPQEFRDRGMARGTSVHWMTQLEDQGALNYRTVPKALRGYRKSWNDWKKASGFVPIAIEYRFIWEDFAGIIDRVGTFPPNTMYPHGSHAIVDLKSGDVQDWVKCQLAPYAVAWMQSIKLARFIRRIAVRVNGDGSPARVKEFTDFDHDFAKFTRAKEKVHDSNANGG